MDFALFSGCKLSGVDTGLEIISSGRSDTLGLPRCFLGIFSSLYILFLQVFPFESLQNM